MGGGVLQRAIQNVEMTRHLTCVVGELLDVGDTLRTTCTWVNNTPNNVSFGENT